MVKVRMNTADVAAEVKCLRRLIGMRCANVYDISPKTYLFKLMNSSGITESGVSEKVLLLIESGIRLHTTEYVRDKNTTPSGFTLKLRKHIRTKRLEDVRQLGYDRIIIFQFGLGESAYYVILELYAQGNVILADSDFVVMTLLRSHRDDDKGLAIMSRHRYPVESCRTFERTSFSKLKDSITSYKPYDANESSVVDEAKGLSSSKDRKFSESTKKSKEGTRANKSTLKNILGEVLSYGPALAEHVILDAGLLPHLKVGSDNSSKVDEDTIKALAQAINRFEEWLEDIMSGERVPEGFIVMQNKANSNKETTSADSSTDKVYDEFCPILLNQFKSRERMTFDTFDAALDEFYSKIESQRVDLQQKAKEETAMQKLNKIRSDQENRVLSLKKEVDHCVKMAELIEYNLADVEAAILAVRVALANGMDWEDLRRMVKEEKKLGNPVAGLIDKLHLERNSITLLLSNNLDEMDDDEKTSPVDKVEVDLALSAHANARRWYELKKKQETKQDKTITAHEKAFKAAEKKTRLQLAQEKNVAAITHMRKVHWFEKFNWFITSENYLVISGRDAQQNEMIVKRYMSKGDLYVHADLHGASSTVIKNHKPDGPVPPLSLNQAGCFTVCHSQAWNSKIVTSAWWVYPHQVSKTAPTGEYLTVGSFMIRGRKNFLPPHPLVMGFGILFRLDESSLGSHLNERRVRGEDDNLDEIEGDSHKESSDSDSSNEIAGEGGINDELNLGTSLSRTEQHSTSDAETVINMQSLPSKVADQPNELILDNLGQPNNSTCETIASRNERREPSVPADIEDLIDKALGVGPARPSYGNSVLDIPPSLGDSGINVTKDSVREKPYISKAERRKLKKGQKNNADGGTAMQDVENGGSMSPDFKQHISSEVKQVSSKMSRGQKGKLRKIKEKYAEQDEEERAIRMALLASSGKASKNVSVNGDGAAVKSPKPLTGQHEVSKICYKCKKPGHLSRDCPEYTVENDHSQRVMDKDASDGTPKDVPRAELDRNRAEMDKVDIEEDGIHEIPDEEREKLNDIDYLTGSPLPDDILLYAVPVCGPYSALQTYKYRVKITPGTAKKGKAAKTAMNLFSHMPEVTNREKELMKACTDPELVAAIVGNAKITAPGLTQLKQKQKKGKKSGKND